MKWIKIKDSMPKPTPHYDDTTYDVIVRYKQEGYIKQGVGYMDFDGDEFYWSIRDTFGKDVKSPYELICYAPLPIQEPYWDRDKQDWIFKKEV